MSSTLVLFTLALSVGVFSGLVGAWIGKRSGRPEAGFIWSFVLGPVGWLVPLGGLLLAMRRQH